MHQEIVCATEFIVKLLGSTLTHPHKDSFRERLAEALAQHCSEHWFPEQPHLGSAYRCVRSEGERCDPLLRNAAEKAGVALTQLTFPQSFAVWIDPSDVSARIGERGSIFSLQDGNGANNISASVSASASNSTGSSVDGISGAERSPVRTPSPLAITSPLGSPRMSHHHHQPQQQPQQQQQQQQMYHFQPQPQYHHQVQYHQQQQPQPQIWSHNQRQPLVVYA